MLIQIYLLILQPNMTNERFKEIFETNRSDLFQLCYIYYLEEAKGQKCDYNTFQDVLNMWLVMNGGMNRIINYLKQKHNL